MVQVILRMERLLCEYDVHKSEWISMSCGVLYGPVLAQLLFNLYMLPLSQIMRKNQIAYHSYAGDTQLYYRLKTTAPLTPCANALMKLYRNQNVLQVNKDKTEVTAFGNKDEVLKVNTYLDAGGQITKNQVKNQILV